MGSVRSGQLPARRRRAAKGSSRIPRNRGGRIRPSGAPRSSATEAGGNCTVRVRVGTTVFAGKDHDVPVSRVQVDGPMAAVAPDGRPVTVRVIGAGNSVPLVGTMASAYVAEPPGAAV